MELPLHMLSRIMPTHLLSPNIITEEIFSRFYIYIYMLYHSEKLLNMQRWLFYYLALNNSLYFKQVIYEAKTYPRWEGRMNYVERIVSNQIKFSQGKHS